MVTVSVTVTVAVLPTLLIPYAPQPRAPVPNPHMDDLCPARARLRIDQNNMTSGAARNN